MSLPVLCQYFPRRKYQINDNINSILVVSDENSDNLLIRVTDIDSLSKI